MRTDTVAYTDEIAFPWTRPPVVSYYSTTRARWANRCRRIKRSQFAADLSAGWQRSLTILGAFAAVYAFIVVLRGAAVAADMLGGLQ